MTVSKFAAKVSVSVAKRALKGGKVRRTISGKVAVPAGVTRAQGCTGSVTLTIKRSGRSVLNQKVPLSERLHLQALRHRGAWQAIVLGEREVRRQHRPEHRQQEPEVLLMLRRNARRAAFAVALAALAGAAAPAVSQAQTAPLPQCTSTIGYDASIPTWQTSGPPTRTRTPSSRSAGAHGLRRRGHANGSGNPARPAAT